VSEQRGREDEIDRLIADWQYIIYISFPGYVISFANVVRPMELKSLAVKVAAAPVQHLVINVNAYISAGEHILLEPVVPKMLRKAPAAATNVQETRIQPAQS
jgi:hypothetical protein